MCNLNLPAPEVGCVNYIALLDEIADNKGTIISDLHMVMHNHAFLVLEGDAKMYDVIQDIKHEYGSDLDWLVPFPGDWHFLKNYQLCLMKPLFDAGLRDLAITTGNPANSIQNKRTHHFLLETYLGGSI